MILLLHGDNRFERGEYLAGLLESRGVEPEYVDGDTFDIDSLASLTQGQSLFAEDRLVLIDGLSQNSDAWEAFSKWIEKFEVGVDLVILEGRLDKRKLVTKSIIKKSTAKEFKLLKEGDSGAAVSWLMEWSESKRGVKLERTAAVELVGRVGFDQGMLVGELDRLLSLGDAFGVDAVRRYTPDRVESKVFGILEAAIKRNHSVVLSELQTLKATSDPYSFLGLITSQLVQFAGVWASSDVTKVSSELKLNAYALKSAQRIGVDGARLERAVGVVAEADYKMKTTSADPWGLVELALIDIALN